MTDTTISDAVVFPQDTGTGVSDADYNSAGYFSAISKYKGDDTYVGEDSSGSPTLQFANVDTSNDTVDVQSGYAYIAEGSQDVQDGSNSTYGTTLPMDVPYVVVMPTAESGLSLGTSTTNDLWLALDQSSNDSAYIRHGSGLSAPSDPSVKLGTVDTSNGNTTRVNDLSSATFNSVDTEKIVATNETFVRAERSSQSSSISAGTRINVFDGDVKDSRNEFNSSQQFVPDKDGEYQVTAEVLLEGSTSAGDEIEWIFKNVTDGTFPDGGSTLSTEASRSSCRLLMSFPVLNLTAGKAYEFQVRNEDSSFKIGSGTTHGTIVRSVVQ